MLQVVSQLPAVSIKILLSGLNQTGRLVFSGHDKWGQVLSRLDTVLTLNTSLLICISNTVNYCLGVGFTKLRKIICIVPAFFNYHTLYHVHKSVCTYIRKVVKYYPIVLINNQMMIKV